MVVKKFLGLLICIVTVSIALSCSQVLPYDLSASTAASGTPQAALSRGMNATYTAPGVEIQTGVGTDWGSGFTYIFTVKNTSATPKSAWSVDFRFDRMPSLGNNWSAVYTFFGDGFIARPVSCNSTIPANGSISFGYVVNEPQGRFTTRSISFSGQKIFPQDTGAPTQPPTVSKTPVEKYGQLSVRGNRIVDAAGQEVQLRGLSTHGLQWFPFTDNQTVPNLVGQFKIDVIRAAMYVKEYDAQKALWAGYLGEHAWVRNELIEVVEDAIDAGIYVIVDWHLHWNNPDPANPHWTANPYTQEAVSFFAGLGSYVYRGKALKDYPNVIWEVMNEPGHSIAWTEVKQHANAVINQIRYGNGDSDNLILVPASNWAQNLDTVAWDGASDRPDRLHRNIVYTLHFYSSSHGASVRSQAQTALNAGLAVFASEWGSGDYTGNGSPSYQDSQTWIDWMAANKVSWTAWNISDKAEATAVFTPNAGLSGPWTSQQLSTTGTWLKTWIQQGR